MLNEDLDCALVAGVDTHRDSHAVALCDGLGRVLAERQAPATPAGYAAVLAWALAAILVTAPAPLREQLRHLPPARRARECAALRCPGDADRQTRVLHQTLTRLGQRITALAATAADLETLITGIVDDMAPGLVAAEPGLGALSAAQILLSYSHPGRIRSHPATLAYIQRRRAEGKTDKEIRRCLKRYLARHMYRTLNTQITRTT